MVFLKVERAFAPLNFQEGTVAKLPSRAMKVATAVLDVLGRSFTPRMGTRARLGTPQARSSIPGTEFGNSPGILLESNC